MTLHDISGKGVDDGQLLSGGIGGGEAVAMIFERI
jgi:hypothetical protein